MASHNLFSSLRFRDPPPIDNKTDQSENGSKYQ